MIADIIIVEWLLTAIGASVFLLVYGRPWRYRDRTMAWHIYSMAAAALLEMFGLFAATWSLIPAMIAYGLTGAIIYWRLGLLLSSRRNTPSEDSTKT